MPSCRCLLFSGDMLLSQGPNLHYYRAWDAVFSGELAHHSTEATAQSHQRSRLYRPARGNENSRAIVCSCACVELYVAFLSNCESSCIQCPSKRGEVEGKKRKEKGKKALSRWPARAHRGRCQCLSAKSIQSSPSFVRHLPSIEAFFHTQFHPEVERFIHSLLSTTFFACFLKGGWHQSQETDIMPKTKETRKKT